jgi:feruloyl esterase
LPGAEEGSGGWATWITGPAAKQSLTFLFANGYFSYMVYEKPDWDYKTFRLEPALKAAEDKTALALNATNADLRPFQSRGGKLILYHGWDDPAIPAVNTIDYYNSVVTKLGQQNVDSFVRLYMVPGMQHCAGGTGADSFGQDESLVPDDPQHSVHHDRRLQVCRQRSGASCKDNAAAVCLSTGREVPGRWRYKRRRELCMCAAEEVTERVGSPADTNSSG